MLEQVGSTPQTIRELATAIRSAKTNLTVPYGNDAERVLGVQGVLYMALMELHGAGFEYAGGSQKMLPCVYSHLHHTLMESRARRRMDAKRKRVGSPRDLALMLVESVKDVGRSTGSCDGVDRKPNSWWSGPWTRCSSAGWSTRWHWKLRRNSLISSGHRISRARCRIAMRSTLCHWLSTTPIVC